MVHEIFLEIMYNKKYFWNIKLLVLDVKVSQLSSCSNGCSVAALLSVIGQLWCVLSSDWLLDDWSWCGSQAVPGDTTVVFCRNLGWYLRPTTRSVLARLFPFISALTLVKVILWVSIQKTPSHRELVSFRGGDSRNIFRPCMTLQLLSHQFVLTHCLIQLSWFGP